MKKNVIIDLFKNAGVSVKRINKLSVETGFIKRIGKIKALYFLVYMITESVRGCVSYNDLAAIIQFETGKMASRQAYHNKINVAALEFFKAILATIMHTKANINIPRQFRRFKRIIVQDSTVIKLPSKLMKVFSGVKNAHTKVCNARVQCVYDLLSGSFLQFSIDSYSKNDLAVASELQVNAGDLILRDRGYFIINELQRIIKARGDFVSRYKHKTLLFHPETGKEIDLLRLLKKQNNIDMTVLIGTDNQIEVRIIAAAVSQETADRRRQKAKKECKGHNPGKDCLSLMGWTIYFTSLDSKDLDINIFVKLYGLRWRIENIFKTWKSNFNFDKIHAVGENQLKLILMARFIAMTLFYQNIYLPLFITMANKCKRWISLMKLMRYISRNIMAIPQLLKAAGGTKGKLKVVEKYCTYDKRKRLNYADNELFIVNKLENMTKLT